MSIKKADYIAKYGEEAWAIESERRKKYNKRWREEHPDYKKQYYEDNKQQIAEQTKQYRKEHAEEKKEYLKQYRKNNKEKIAAYRTEHKEKISVQQAAWLAERRSTPIGRAEMLLGRYSQRDKERGFDISLNVDAKWIEKNILTQQCVYCGESDWRKLGVDRVDNTKGHTPENCLCACGKCNVERGDRYSVEEFVLIKKKEKGGE